MNEVNMSTQPSNRPTSHVQVDPGVALTTDNGLFYEKSRWLSSYTPQLPPPSHKPPFTKPKVTFTKRGRNPVDTNGQTTGCGICDSINHRARECPDQPHQSTSAYFTHATADPDVLDINYVTDDVTLFQSDFDSPTHLQGLVAEPGIMLFWTAKQARLPSDGSGSILMLLA